MEWSCNPIKLRRAIDALPKDATEEQVKAEYIRIGGLVVEQPIVEEVVVTKKTNVSKPRVLVAQKKATKTKRKA